MSLLLLGSGPGGSGGAAFSGPSDISGLKVYYNASSGVLKTGGVPAGDGETVVAWEDQSASGIDLIGFGAVPYDVDGINSLPSVNFPAGLLIMYQNYASITPAMEYAPDSSFSIWGVFDHLDANDFHVFGYVNQGWRILTTGASDVLAFQHVGTGAVQVTGNTSIGNNTPVYFIATYGGAGASSVSLWVSGVSQTISTASDNLTAVSYSGSQIKVGQFAGSDSHGKVRILGVHDGAFSAGDVANMNSWLATNGGF